MVFPLKHLDLVGTGRRLHCGREKQKSRDPCVCKHFGHVTANHSRPLQSVYSDLYSPQPFPRGRMRPEGRMA